MLLGRQDQVQRNDFATLAVEGLFEQGVTCLYEAQSAVGFEDRKRAIVGQRKAGLGPDEVHRRKKIPRFADLRQVGTDHLRKTGQDPDSSSSSVLSSLFSSTVSIGSM